MTYPTDLLKFQSQHPALYLTMEKGREDFDWDYLGRKQLTKWKRGLNWRKRKGLYCWTCMTIAYLDMEWDSSNKVED